MIDAALVWNISSVFGGSHACQIDRLLWVVAWVLSGLDMYRASKDGTSGLSRPNISVSTSVY